MYMTFIFQQLCKKFNIGMYICIHSVHRRVMYYASIKGIVSVETLTEIPISL